ANPRGHAISHAALSQLAGETVHPSGFITEKRGDFHHGGETNHAIKEPAQPSADLNFILANDLDQQHVSSKLRPAKTEPATSAPTNRPGSGITPSVVGRPVSAGQGMQPTTMSASPSVSQPSPADLQAAAGASLLQSGVKPVQSSKAKLLQTFSLQERYGVS